MKMRLFCTAVLTSVFCFSLQFGTFAQENPETDSKFDWPKDESVIPGQGHLRNSDWFKGHYKNRRIGFAKNAAEKQNAIVFLGDSITKVWDHRLEKVFQKLKL